jgi:plastocyanin
MGPTHPNVGAPTNPTVGAMIRLPAALLALAVGLALSGIGCGGGGGTDSTGGAASAAGTDSSVTISDYKYEPATIVVPAGSTVVFTNRDSTPHTATSTESGAFDSGSIDTGKTGRIKLEDPGNYTYYCAFHPFMKGTVRVE